MKTDMTDTLFTGLLPAYGKEGIFVLPCHALMSGKADLMFVKTDC